MSKAYLIGIDEAGKGCVIGDIFVAAVVLREDVAKELMEQGFKDHKELTKMKRLNLYNLVLEKSEEVVVVRIKPDEIDNRNINDLLHWTYAKLVKDFASRYEPISRISIDMCGTPDRLIRLMPKSLRKNVVVEHEAEERYVECSAASIVAKVYREWHIEYIKNTYGDIGSGYPSDPKTREWLKKYYEEHKCLPPIVRKSWKTVQKIAPTEYKTKGTLPITLFLRT